MKERYEVMKEGRDEGRTEETKLGRCEGRYRGRKEKTKIARR